jgi:hypothetical protein
MTLVGRIASVAALILAVSVQAVWAGVTVHYEGWAQDQATVDKILSIARAEAARRGWEVKDASVRAALVNRIVDGKELPYRGPLKGIVLFPDPCANRSISNSGRTCSCRITSRPNSPGRTYMS